MDVIVSDIKTIKQGEFLKVMVEFINADNESRDLVYQIEWYDRDGMLKDSIAGDQIELLVIKKKIKEMATFPSVTDYKIIISTKK